MRQTSHGVWLPDRDTHFEHCLDNPKKKGDLGLYQPHIYRMALKSVWKRPPDCRWRVAIDIGAHVGLLSRQMAEDFAGVIAFEPWPENVACFRNNVVNPNVQLLDVALGSERRNAGLRVVPHNSGANYIEDGGNLVHKFGAELVDVPMCTLDQYDIQAVDFIKIDVQGHEEEVLRGGSDTIHRCTPVILIEQVGDDEGAIDLLVAWGYKEVERWTKDRVMTWRT